MAPIWLNYATVSCRIIMTARRCSFTELREQKKTAALLDPKRIKFKKHDPYIRLPFCGLRFYSIWLLDLRNIISLSFWFWKQLTFFRSVLFCGIGPICIDLIGSTSFWLKLFGLGTKEDSFAIDHWFFQSRISLAKHLWGLAKLSWSRTIDEM